MFIKNFSEKSEFPQTMRLTRVVSILIKKFNEILVMECEIFLSMFVKILEPENPLWLRVLAMEIFKGVCSDAQLTSSIYKWYDGQNNSSTNVFRDMITGFGRLATEKPQSIGAGQGGRDSFDYSGANGGGGSGTTGYHLSGHANQSSSSGAESGLSTANSTMRIQCIDQLDKADPPAIPETYIFYLALVCLNSVADGLAGFALSNFSPGSVIKQTQEEKDSKDVKVVTDMANVAWPGLLAAMSFYLTANLDQELFQSTMRSYQNFTNVCGVLDLVTPRDAFLTNLCKNSIPIIPLLSSGFVSSTSNNATLKLLNSSNMSSTSIGTVSSAVASVNQAAVAFADLPVQQQQALSNITLNDKNLYSLRVLLNIAMFLSSVLGSSWYLVLETLQLADFLLFNRPTPKGSSTGGGGGGGGSGGTGSTGNVGIGASPATPMTNSLRRTMTGSSHDQQTMMDADHLTIISASFQRLFENSKYLDDDSFIAFSSALCRMSSEVSGTPFIDHASSLPTSNKASKAVSWYLDGTL